MFFDHQIQNQRQEYLSFLKTVGGLSNLFSDSNVPYLYYRIAEKIFCRAFDAEDLSRSDVSVDAKKGTLGIWLKTFLAGNGRTLQKVAEFNADRPLYENLTPAKLVRKIAHLRNERITFTQATHGLTNSIYHCVLREEWRFVLFEEAMDMIAIENIGNVKKSASSISFTDGLHEYSFSLSKSTLMKRFCTNQEPRLQVLEIDLLEDPLLALRWLFTINFLQEASDTAILETVYLPLYGRDHIVYPKSGLNQRNAWWRARHADEVYIPIPVEIHHHFPGFFPWRDSHFDLHLPNGNTMRAKVCQDWGKALMSESNRELGHRILREVLRIPEWTLVTSETLDILGIDSVRIDKRSDWSFDINFAKKGSYDDFVLRRMT